MRIYQATVSNPRYCVTEHETAEAAATEVETAGSGNVVQFIRSPNAPDRLPKFVDRSAALWSYQDGKWYRHAIFDGLGSILAEERPN